MATPEAQLKGLNSGEPAAGRRQGTRMVRQLAGVLACGLLAGCSAHAVAGNTGQAAVPASRYLVCQSLVGICVGGLPAHEPSVLYLSGDGTLVAKHLSWTGWGTAMATGHGTGEADNCKPDCVNGAVTAYPVTVVLTQPRRWHHDVVYSRAAVAVSGLDDRFTVSSGLVPTPRPSGIPG
jgi:hypothetical protein